MSALMDGGIFHYLQSIQAYISPPIAAVFLLGLYFKWINARGAIVTLWTGFVIGIFRLIMEFMSNNNNLTVAPNSLLAYFLDINFLHFAFFLFIFCSIILMVVSKMGKPPSIESLALVTFQEKTKASPFKWTLDIALTGLLIILVLLLWLIFSPFGIG